MHQEVTFKSDSLVILIKRLWGHINSKRRAQFLVLFFLMVIASFSEVISLGAVLPFLTVLTAPEKVFQYQSVQFLIEFFDITAPSQLLLPLTIFFGSAVIFAGVTRLMLLWVSTRLSFAAGADISYSIYQKTLYQSYDVHVSRNSSEVITGISTKANSVIYSVILPLLTLISSSVMLLVILIALFYIDPLIATAAFVGFASIYILIIKLTKKRILIDSDCIAKESTKVIKSLQEGLGGIRDVLIDGAQSIYCNAYRSADIPLRRAQGNNLFISQSPRYAMEALGMLLIAFLAYMLSQRDDGLVNAIPILGALALGAQRLLPILQQAYSSFTNIRGSQASLMDVLLLLNQPLPELKHNEVNFMSFNNSIELENISYQYTPKNDYVINALSFKIPKGSRIGFIGKTGSGKSTLLDIVMGLLQPQIGKLKVDGVIIDASNSRSWQTHVAHVPQSIFLADSSIEENIAFGVPKEEIDRSRVVLAAKQAQISDVIESWPEGYDTYVGERGIRLSGGQRQRIGIARALYKKADLIILDEATSALDNETETSVMAAIEQLGDDITVLIIAHRLSTLKNCHEIVELSNGKVLRTGSYNQIVT